MYSELIKIGNSKGLRIPKAILEQCGFEKSVHIRVEGNCLIIEPVKHTRFDWEQAFQAMAQAGDDALLLPEETAHAFDTDEWTW